MDLLGNASIQRLEGAIHAASMRQQVLSNNIANVDTPYFKRSDVVFEELLTQAMGTTGGKSLSGRRTDTRHIPIGNSETNPQARVRTESSSVINNNSSNVDIEKEMAMLAENQLRYNLYVQQINHEVKMMRTGIEGR